MIEIRIIGALDSSLAQVVKQARCSDQGSVAADALSKGSILEARQAMSDKLEKNKRVIPRSLQLWLQDPVPDMELGLRIAMEIGNKVEVLKWDFPRMTTEDRRKCLATRWSEDRRLGPRPKELKSQGKRKHGGEAGGRIRRKKMKV